MLLQILENGDLLVNDPNPEVGGHTFECKAKNGLGEDQATSVLVLYQVESY